jgi:hypothetical protein
MEGQSIDPIEARLSSVVTELQQIVLDTAGHYIHRVNVNNSILHQGYGNGNASNGCWSQPANLCASLIQSSIDDVIPFRLALCLCAAVCMVSYTSEAEAEAEAVMSRQAVNPACIQTGAVVEVEAVNDQGAVQSSQSKSNSRKRKSPIVDNTPAVIDGKCRGTAPPSTASVGGNNASHEITLGHDEVTFTRQCRPDFFVQLDPGLSSSTQLARLICSYSGDPLTSGCCLFRVFVSYLKWLLKLILVIHLALMILFYPFICPIINRSFHQFVRKSIHPCNNLSVHRVYSLRDSLIDLCSAPSILCCAVLCFTMLPCAV